MTLLNWELTPNHVVILSDTLCISGDDKRPRSFMTKVYPAPHISAVITGTGISKVVTEFYVRVTTEMIVSDVVHLNEFAPDSLRAIWAELAGQIPGGATATIYTFGLSPEDGAFTGFAYRSTSNFDAEQMQHGMGVKPAPASGTFPEINGLADFVKLAYAQQAEDRALPRMQRVGIGGELWMYTMLKDDAGALDLRTQSLGAMLNYDEDLEVMLARLPENEGHPLSIIALARDP
jgi:hypothetical protein